MCQLLTSFEKASILKLLQSKLLRSDAHQGDPASSQVRLELADFCSCPPAYLTAKPAQKEENNGLVLPQRLELHILEHRKDCYQWGGAAQLGSDEFPSDLHYATLEAPHKGDRIIKSNGVM